MNMKETDQKQRSEGLKHKYNVERVDGKPVDDCIVLEFRDPNSHAAMLTWADTVEADGYKKLAEEVRFRVSRQQHEQETIAAIENDEEEWSPDKHGTGPLSGDY